MRLFAAVWPTEEVRAAISATVLRMRKEPAAADWRWVRPEHWHVTVAFYGTVTESQLPELIRRLELAGRRRSRFELELGHPGHFGDRVVWLGLDGDRDALRRLAEGAAAAGRRAGVELDSRRFRPHLTLARSRHGGDAARLLTVAVPALSWPVDTFALVQSRTGPRVQYDALAEFGLSGG